MYFVNTRNSTGPRPEGPQIEKSSSYPSCLQVLSFPRPYPSSSVLKLAGTRSPYTPNPSKPYLQRKPYSPNPTGAHPMPKTRSLNPTKLEKTIVRKPPNARNPEPNAPSPNPQVHTDGPTPRARI